MLELMIRINKNIGARVEVYRVLTAINPLVGWQEVKKRRVQLWKIKTMNIIIIFVMVVTLL